MLTTSPTPPHRGKAFPTAPPIGPPCQALFEQHHLPLPQPKVYSHQSPRLSSFIIDPCPSTDLLIHHLGAPCPPVPAQKFPGGQQESLGVWRLGGPRLSHQASVGAPRQGSDPRPLWGPGVPCGFRQGTSLSEPPLQDWSGMRQGVPRQPSVWFLRPFPGSAHHREQGNKSTCRLSIHLFINVSHRRRCLRGQRPRVWGGRQHGYGNLPRQLFTKDSAASWSGHSWRLRDLPACVSPSPCESTQEGVPRA